MRETQKINAKYLSGYFFYKKKVVVFVALGIVLLIGTSSTSIVHKYYVSLTEVNVNSSKHTLDVSSKLFLDDVELELEKEYGKKIEITSQDKSVSKYLSDYVFKNFKINVGGKLQKLEFVGFEIEGDAVWCYSEVHAFKGSGTISIMNSLLYGNFPEQSNLMNVNKDGNSKSHKLSNPDKLADFTF